MKFKKKTARGGLWRPLGPRSAPCNLKTLSSLGLFHRLLINIERRKKSAIISSTLVLLTKLLGCYSTAIITSSSPSVWIQTDYFPILKSTRCQLLHLLSLCFIPFLQIFLKSSTPETLHLSAVEPVPPSIFLILNGVYQSLGLAHFETFVCTLVHCCARRVNRWAVPNANAITWLLTGKSLGRHFKLCQNTTLLYIVYIINTDSTSIPGHVSLCISDGIFKNTKLRTWRRVPGDNYFTDWKRRDNLAPRAQSPDTIIYCSSLLMTITYR